MSKPSSRYKGVREEKPGHWKVQFTYRGVQHNRGTFPDERSAVEARKLLVERVRATEGAEVPSTADLKRQLGFDELLLGMGGDRRSAEFRAAVVARARERERS